MGISGILLNPLNVGFIRGFLRVLATTFTNSIKPDPERAKGIQHVNICVDEKRAISNKETTTISAVCSLRSSFLKSDIRAKSKIATRNAAEMEAKMFLNENAPTYSVLIVIYGATKSLIKRPNVTDIDVKAAGSNNLQQITPLKFDVAINTMSNAFE